MSSSSLDWFQNLGEGLWSDHPAVLNPLSTSVGSLALELWEPMTQGGFGSTTNPTDPVDFPQQLPKDRRNPGELQDWRLPGGLAPKSFR